MKGKLTAEGKLNIALHFLAQHNKGSYLYPNVIELEKHLKEKNIEEKEHLPILLHLIRGKYVDAYYKDKHDEERGIFPHQIKITFRGIKFIEKGGYINLLKEEKKANIMSWASIIISVISVLFTGLNIYINSKKSESINELEKRIQQIEFSKSNK